jgi:hypothetical protein
VGQIQLFREIPKGFESRDPGIRETSGRSTATAAWNLWPTAVSLDKKLGGNVKIF